MIPPGATVTVLDSWPEANGPAHIRTPHYLRGRHGQILRHLGDFPNPEALAFGRTAALLGLYHVVFDARTLWPDATANELVVEIFDSWLTPA